MKSIACNALLSLFSRLFRNHHYGKVTVKDTGNETCLFLEGIIEGDYIPAFQVEVCTPTVINGVIGGGTSDCSISYMPTTFSIIVGAMLTLIPLCAIYCIFKASKRKQKMRQWGSSQVNTLSSKGKAYQIRFRDNPIYHKR